MKRANTFACLLAGAFALSWSSLTFANQADGVGAGGGGDHDVTLQSMLPRAVWMSVYLDYRKATVRPLITYSKCFLVDSCNDQIEGIHATARYELKLDPAYPAMDLQYLPAASSVNYLYEGKRHRAPIQEFADRALKPIESGSVKVISARFPGAWYQVAGSDGGYDNTTGWHTIDIGKDADERHSKWEIRIDGRTETERGEKLVDQLNRAYETLVAQTDFASPVGLVRFKSDHDTFKRVVASLLWIGGPVGVELRELWNRLVRDDREPEYGTLESRFISRLADEARGMTEQAKSVITADGACDKEKYLSFMSRLEKWTIGSASWFLDMRTLKGELEGKGLLRSVQFSQSNQLQSRDIRRRLIKFLKQEVLPRCEPQHGKVELLLEE